MIDAALRRAVRERAERRCEYCRMSQETLPYIPLQVEHVVARKHGGSDDLANLALACYHCNLGKSSNLSGLDPWTGDLTALFHPRRMEWNEHFLWRGAFLDGATPAGRVAVLVLNVNEPEWLAFRRETLARGFAW